jgi:Mrp family chromosome partitioning ATPase
MNALDKAFIKAYARGVHGGAVASPPELNEQSAAAASQNRAAVEIGQLSPLVEVSAADGVWYRIEQPAVAERSVPAPHAAFSGAHGARVRNDAALASPSAVDMLDSLLGLGGFEPTSDSDEPQAALFRIDAPRQSTERRTVRQPQPPAPAPREQRLEAHELEAFLQGAASSVTAQWWTDGNAHGSTPDSLCQCCLATGHLVTPLVIEQTWFETPTTQLGKTSEHARFAERPEEKPTDAAPTKPTRIPSTKSDSDTRTDASTNTGSATLSANEASSREVSLPVEPLSANQACSPKADESPRVDNPPASEVVAKTAAVVKSEAFETTKDLPKDKDSRKIEAVSPKIEATYKVDASAKAAKSSLASATPKSAAASTPKEPSQKKTPASPSQSQSPKAAAPTFHAAWEVDRLNWPEECDRLSKDDAFGPLAQTLIDASRRGKKVIAITGLGRGEGRTTLTLCVARRIAQEGVRVAVLDADFERPHLGRRLGIDMENGWDDVLTDGQPLAEAAVSSLADQLTILPLGRRAAAFVSAHTVAALQQASQKFDLVLVDMGPVSDEDAHDASPEASSTAAAILVADHRTVRDEQLSAALERLEAAGVETLGVVETFV